MEKETNKEKEREGNWAHGLVQMIMLILMILGMFLHDEYLIIPPFVIFLMYALFGGKK